MKKEEIQKKLEEYISLKPKDLIIDDLHWKYLAWGILRGKNILFVGPTRSGKTSAVKSIHKITNEIDNLSKRNLYIFNLGSSQDARSLLIGNTFFKKDTGTLFCQSEFVKAIQTPNSIILLDEMSRLSHDGTNIILPVIDTTQRCLRLDETENSMVIPVAEGVSFVATANIGNEYTATRVMDKALTYRFPVIIEMKILSGKEEKGLLDVLFPDASKEERDKFRIITTISEETKLTCRMENPRISTYITTDLVIEMAGLICDGFTLIEIAEMVIYPIYNEDGGQECERTFVKQLIQKYIDKVSSKVKSPIINTVEF